MSASRPDPAERLLAEHHLGERLSALVDGELGHETRERVLAHLATCAKCRSEADAQRRLKNVFAEAAPPPPSESFLARLQGLPAGGDADGGSPLGGSGVGAPPGRSSTRGGVFDLKRGGRFEFGYVPVAPHATRPPASGTGFRTHPVARPDTDRSASPRIRFAFVAAGAVSLAAIALGGVTGGVPADAETRGGPGGSNVTPARSQNTGLGATPENQRRRGVGAPLAQGRRTPGSPVAPAGVSAPLLPGIPAQDAVWDTRALAVPLLAGATTSPLIRPLRATPLLPSTAWSPGGDGAAAPSLLAAPVSGPAPSPSGSPGSSATGR